MLSTSRPLVSVLITVYNAAPYLGEAIDSALAQTYQPVQVVVVDDGSDDGSAEVARRYGRSLLYDYQARGGIGAARNRAVELARGSFFTFLDADDRFPPDKLTLQMAAFDCDPELEVVYGHVREFVSPDLDQASAGRIRPAVERSPSHLSGVMLIRRDAVLRVGPFATGLKVGTGVQWYARSLEHQLKTTILPQVLLERRLHLQNNGLREADSRIQYVHILKAALDRRRSQRAENHLKR
jgi:glycosyltransferase involved in cell wall biosynthesis